MLTCQKCGYDNELGRIFCHQCGTKLDLSQIKPPGQGGKKLRRRGTTSIGKVLSLTFRLGVLILLIGTVALGFMVPALRALNITDKDRQAVRDKRYRLEQMMLQRKAVETDLNEVELNAYLSTFTFEKPKEGGGLVMQPTNLQIELGDGAVTLVLVGIVKLPGNIEKKLAFRLRGLPALENSEFVFKPVGGAIGALPLPAAVVQNTSFLQGYFDSIFGSLLDEKSLLDKMASISVTPSAVRLSYKP